MTGCGAESGPTAETTPGLAADSHTAEHSSTTYSFEDYVGNPCNGETVHLTGVGVQQTTVVAAASSTTNSSSWRTSPAPA